MRWLKLSVLLVLLFPLFMPLKAKAATADVVITAQGIVVAAPGDFTLTYITDYEVGISWTKPPLAVNTMVRVAYGRQPTSITDGYQVYYGVGTSATDNATSLAAPDITFYAAWSQRADGLWSPLFASGDTGGFMSASFLFIGLIAIACFLTWMASRRPNILVAFASGLTWLAMGFWVLLGDVTNLGLESSWTQILAWVLIIMTFVPFLLQMNVEIHNEAKGQRWTEYGSKPKITNPTSYEAYKAELQRRVRGRR